MHGEISLTGHRVTVLLAALCTLNISLLIRALTWMGRCNIFIVHYLIVLIESAGHVVVVYVRSLNVPIIGRVAIRLIAWAVLSAKELCLEGI